MINIITNYFKQSLKKLKRIKGNELLLLINAVIALLGILILFDDEDNRLEVDNVKLYKCVDGDTAWFTLNSENIKVRFLAIDTPESTNKKEDYGEEAAEYTCNQLKKAANIKLEYETKNKVDRYGRKLAYIFVDDKLLQEELLKEGYAEIKYEEDYYRYIDKLKDAEITAKRKELNIWN